MPLRHGRKSPESADRTYHHRYITASVGLVQSGQHLEHNAQRQEAPTRSTTYFAATIEGKKNPRLEFWLLIGY